MNLPRSEAAMNVRLAVFLPAGPVPGWVVRLVGDCLELPDVRLVALLRDGSPLPAADWADRVDEMVFDRGASPLRLVELPTPAGVAEWIAPTAEPADAWLATRGCDVLLDLRTAPMPMAVSPTHHWALMLSGRPAVTPLAGADPVVEGADSTVIQLETIPGGAVIDTSLGASCTFSIRRNRRRAIAKGMGMVRRALVRLTVDGNVAPLPEVPAGGVDAFPGSPAAQRFATLVRRTVSRSASKALSRDQWGLALVFEDALCLDPARATLIHPPADRFWADPMVWPAEGGGWWVFIEEVIYREGRGTLKAMRVQADGSWAEPVSVMVRPWHLSYPFLFEWEGQLWMVPESGANRSVELYRSVSLPDHWEKVADIMTGIDMVDATLFAHEGRWWMLGNVTEPGADKHDELHAYYADSPLGPWQPHAANPVVADARFARPAGPLFMRDGKLLRPAQECVPEYGHALSLRRIERLTPTEYIEHTEQRIEPGWKPGIACVHTLSHAPGLTVFDFLTRRSRFATVRGTRPVPSATGRSDGGRDNSDGKTAQ